MAFKMKIMMLCVKKSIHSKAMTMIEMSIMCHLKTHREIEIEPNEILDSDEEEVIDGVEEGERETPAATETCYYGKDGTEWKKEPNEAIPIRAHNIMRFRAGLCSQYYQYLIHYHQSNKSLWKRPICKMECRKS
uniref:Uncharacterized protein n=1 Tax=Bactrocera latifrons TaxID=174628 RepID=A0A0K8V805_BACLA